ncbi:DnaJ domain-containing protein, partial [Protomyces lactucae-debilis]
RQLEPVGQYFLAHARRKRHGRTFSEDERIEAERNVKQVEEVEEEEADEPESAELLKSDPKNWKQQDHYAVLGLSKYRYKATDAQIKKAHRKKVLKHHPDKKAASGNVNDDSFFKCIAKAHEILSDPVKRRQFDSVDEGADVPTPKKGAKDFYKSWGRAFAAEGRFSTKQPVPVLGNAESSKEEVDQFYNFWYDFDSWRTFEYLDKDLPDDTDNRDQKRYQEKKNKAERQKRKTEDTARLRKMVDDALAIDPRIKMFKDNAKKAKEKAKWDKEAGAREAAEKARLEKEAAEKKAADDEAAAKLARDSNKKAKEDAKKSARKDKKTVKGALKDANYFHDGSDDAPMDVVDKVLTEVEAMMEKFEGLELHELAEKISAAKGDRSQIKAAFVE